MWGGGRKARCFFVRDRPPLNQTLLTHASPPRSRSLLHLRMVQQQVAQPLRRVALLVGGRAGSQAFSQSSHSGIVAGGACVREVIVWCASARFLGGGGWWRKRGHVDAAFVFRPPVLRPHTWRVKRRCGSAKATRHVVEHRRRLWEKRRERRVRWSAGVIETKKKNESAPTSVIRFFSHPPASREKKQGCTSLVPTHVLAFTHAHAPHTSPNGRRPAAHGWRRRAVRAGDVGRVCDRAPGAGAARVEAGRLQAVQVRIACVEREGRGGWAGGRGVRKRDCARSAAFGVPLIHRPARRPAACLCESVRTGSCCASDWGRLVSPATFHSLPVPHLFSLSRAYCSKKLRRLYRSLGLTHGRGRYVKRKLDPAASTEVG